MMVDIDEWFSVWNNEGIEDAAFNGGKPQVSVD